jgi:hypothetical protein
VGPGQRLGRRPRPLDQFLLHLTGNALSHVGATVLRTAVQSIGHAVIDLRQNGALDTVLR